MSRSAASITMRRKKIVMGRRYSRRKEKVNQNSCNIMCTIDMCRAGFQIVPEGEMPLRHIVSDIHEEKWTLHIWIKVPHSDP